MEKGEQGEQAMPMKSGTICGARERGNVLFIVFIAIMIIAGLTFMLSQGSEQGSSSADKTAGDAQISQMLGYTGALAAAVQQMAENGADPATLYTDISLLKPTDAAFNTAPHLLKIYHPMGGGMTPMTETGNPSSSTTVAYNFRINPGSIVEDIGTTDAVVGDILFTARVTSLEYCQRINKTIRGVTTIPAVSNAATVDNLFTDTAALPTAATLNVATCADCVGIGMSCVSGLDGTATTVYGFYATLLPG